MSDALVIELQGESSLEREFQEKGVGVVALQRDGLDGALVATLLVTLAVPLITEVVQILREIANEHDQLKNSKNVYAMEWHGIRFENIQKKQILELIKLLENEYSKSKN